MMADSVGSNRSTSAPSRPAPRRRDRFLHEGAVLPAIPPPQARAAREVAPLAVANTVEVGALDHVNAVLVEADLRALVHAVAAVAPFPASAPPLKIWWRASVAAGAGDLDLRARAAERAASDGDQGRLYQGARHARGAERLAVAGPPRARPRSREPRARARSLILLARPWPRGTPARETSKADPIRRSSSWRSGSCRCFSVAVLPLTTAAGVPKLASVHQIGSVYPRCHRSIIDLWTSRRTPESTGSTASLIPYSTSSREITARVDRKFPEDAGQRRR